MVAARELHDLRRGRSRRGRAAPRSSRPRCPTTRAAPSRPTARDRRSLRRARPRAASARRTTCRRPRRAAPLRRPSGARDRGSTRPTTARSRGTRGRRCRRGARRRARATKNGSPPTDAERADRRVHAAGDARLRALEPDRVTVRRSWSSSATSRAKYVRTMSAPARLIASRCSSATASPSIQPSCAAAFTIAYSPLTWYAATGTSNVGADVGDHVEVRERGLHHHHVGALGDVERDLGERLAAVRGIHLVAAPVAELRRALGRVAERPVQRRRVLRRVGEDRGRRRGPVSSSAARIAPTWPSIIPLGATTSAPASACATAIARVALERRVVVDLAVGVSDAAVPVVGVLVEAVVGHEHQRVADLVAQVAQRDLHDAVGVRRPASRARPSCAGTPNSITAGNAEIGERAHLLAQALLGVLHDAGHRHDRLGCVDAFLHEQRRDEVVDARRGARRPAGAAPACAAAGAGGARGTPRPIRLPARGCATQRPSTRPSIVCGSASASTRSPRSRAVADVTGPIETTSGCGSASGADGVAEVRRPSTTT